MTRRLEIADPDPGLTRRMFELELELERSIAEIVAPIDGGFAVLNPSVPLIWDDSYLVIEQAGRSARDLAALADQVLAPHGIAGRAIVTGDPENAHALGRGFQELGWKIDRGVWMKHRGAPDRPAPVEAREVDRGEIAELRRRTFLESWAGDYSGAPELIAEQWLSRQDAYCEVASARWFVADLDGEPSSSCALLCADDIGQIEWVGSSPRARNRGLARSVVLAATGASRAEGHALTTIGADLDAWPWQLYQRLGFEPIGTDAAFLRP
jgi:GNAT superfamily N-acetyltransferase